MSRFSLLLSLFIPAMALAQPTHTITYNYQASPSAGVTGYYLYQGTGPCSSAVLAKINTLIPGLTGTTPPVAPNIYCGAVTATDGTNESPLSVKVQVQVPPFPATNLSAIDAGTGTNVSWNDSSNPAATLYSVYRKAGPCDPVPVLSQFTKVATGLTTKTFADSTQPVVCYGLVPTFTAFAIAMDGPAVFATKSLSPPTGISGTVTLNLALEIKFSDGQIVAANVAPPIIAVH